MFFSRHEFTYIMFKKKFTFCSSDGKKTSSSSNDKLKKKEISDKLTGPVNGNECYFWRTTGCLYGDKCHYEHIKKNKGIDKKPWHKQQ
jgi:hypothetical protein